MNDTGQIAIVTTSILAPFMPFLIDVGKAASKKLAEVIAQQGGEAAWKKAQALWGKLSAWFGDDPELRSAATMMAVRPQDQTRQSMLAEVLIARLQENPRLAQELTELIGGQSAIQQVLADRGSWVGDIIQHMEGSGEQIVQANENSVIKGVWQSKN